MTLSEAKTRRLLIDKSLALAGWDVGKKIDKPIVGRTLLIKGLEFDHAVILDADNMDAKNLYVAMTRASHTLTVISNDAIIKIPAKRGSA